MELTPEQKREIEESRAVRSETRRVTAAALEEILYEPIPVLDHGFVRPIDYMGDDTAIVQAARVSYGKGTKKVSDDAGLINYLLRHRHTTPFEKCENKYHIKVTIFIVTTSTVMDFFYRFINRIFKNFIELLSNLFF